MNNLLSLAITETLPNRHEFNIIAIDESTKEIFAVKLNKDEIINKSSNQVWWDIGFVTHIERRELIQLSYGNVVYHCIGSELKVSKIDLLRDFLEKQSRNNKSIFSNKTIRYQIAKAKNLKDISYIIDEKGVLKVYVELVVSDGSLSRESRKLLCKDYRWVNYWNYVISKELFNQKKAKFVKLINESDKDIYLILYRHFFETNENVWIAGLHWL